MTEKRFLQGLVAALVSFGVLAAGLQWLFTRTGEIDLSHVLDRQLARPLGEVLFLSGINQNSYRYKLALFDRERPDVVAIGSSRAMELRGELFSRSFITLGGAVNNLENLESVAAHVAASATPPKHAYVLIDPWLFNDRYVDNRAAVPDFPVAISADLLWAGLKSLRRGDWVSTMFRSPDLGIHALNYQEGFARDGSQYYWGTQTGLVKPYDVQFATTFARIDGDHKNFQRNSRADPALVSRICKAIAVLRQSTPGIVLIAPPFASPVWARLSQPDYAYISDGYSQIRACSADLPFFDFANPSSIDGSTDCEFIDGLHGGDVTYARMLRQIAATLPATSAHLHQDKLAAFIDRHQGNAGGSTLALHPGARETDFLGLGCQK